jgi:hypothetical protein
MAICSITRSSQSTTPSETPLKVDDQALRSVELVTPPTPPPDNNVSSQIQSSMHSTNPDTAPVRKCFVTSSFTGLSPLHLHLPAFACRNSGGRSTLPFHHLRRQSAGGFGTQSTSGPFSLSKIGDFAVTQDDPAATRRGSTVISDGHQRKGLVDLRRWSGEQTVLATIRKPLPTLSSSSDRGPPCSILGRKDSCGHDTRSVAQVIPVLQRTYSPDWSTSTKEFEETGTKIEFRCPLEVDEDQEGRVSEDLVAAAAAAPPASSPRLHHHQRQWSDGMTHHRKSGVFKLL